MNSEDKIEVITNVIVIVPLLILIGVAIAYWIWPSEIGHFIRTVLD